MSFHFAIIGGGLTGTAMLLQLVDKLEKKMRPYAIASLGIKVSIYEKQEVFGPGFPHNKENLKPFHITNMCASEMGIHPDKPDDFLSWVFNNRKDIDKQTPYHGETHIRHDRCTHYPRAVMGDYLMEKFQTTVHQARRMGLKVRLYSRSEVIDLKVEKKIQLTVNQKPSGHRWSIMVDRVLLATGHWSRKGVKNPPLLSPWPAKNLLQIPKDAIVAVIGSSLSAIEVVLTLTADGRFEETVSGDYLFFKPSPFRRLVLYSRKGLLPKVRGKIGNYRNKFLTYKNINRLISKNAGSLSLDALFEILNTELESAYGRKIKWQKVLNPTGPHIEHLQQYIEDAIKGDGPDGELLWQTVLHQTFSWIREIFLSMSLKDRKRFDEKYTSLFFVHAATQPVINAKKMLALMRAGAVSVVKLGHDYELIKNSKGREYTFTYTDEKGVKRRDCYRHVVDARGQARQIETDPSALTQNLLRRKLVLTEEKRSSTLSEKPFSQPLEKHQTLSESYRTGSLWIDPATHHIVNMTPTGTPIQNKRIYAVGAMTRGQIIDASMANGIVNSTAKVAENLVEYLAKN